MCSTAAIRHDNSNTLTNGLSRQATDMASILAWQPPPPCERSGNLLEAIRVLKRTFVPHPSCANLAGFCCPHFFVLYSPKSGLYSRSLWMFHLNNTRPDRCSFETSFVDGMLLRAEGTSVQSRDCCNTLRSVKNLRPPEAARSRIVRFSEKSAGRASMIPRPRQCDCWSRRQYPIFVIADLMRAH